MFWDWEINVGKSQSGSIRTESNPEKSQFFDPDPNRIRKISKFESETGPNPIKFFSSTRMQSQASIQTESTPIWTKTDLSPIRIRSKRDFKSWNKNVLYANVLFSNNRCDFYTICALLRHIPYNILSVSSIHNKKCYKALSCTSPPRLNSTSSSIHAGWR